MGNHPTCYWNNKKSAEYVKFLCSIFGKPFIFINRPDGVAIWRKEELSNPNVQLFGQGVCFEKIMVKDDAPVHEYPAPGHTDMLWTFVKIPATKQQVSDITNLCDTVMYDITEGKLIVKCGGLDLNIATLKLCTDIILGNLTLIDAQTTSIYARTLASVRTAKGIDYALLKNLYQSLCVNLADAKNLALKSTSSSNSASSAAGKTERFAADNHLNDPWYASNNPLDLAMAEYNDRLFYRPGPPPEAQVYQYYAAPNVSVNPRTPRAPVSLNPGIEVPKPAAQRKDKASRPLNTDPSPHATSGTPGPASGSRTAGQEHYTSGSNTERDPRFLPYTALISYQIGSNINEITRQYGTVSQKITYPSYANLLQKGLVTDPPSKPVTVKANVPHDFRPLDVVSKTIPQNEVTKTNNGQERYRVYPESDPFLNVLDGKRAAQGPLARLPKEPTGRERMVSYNPSGEDVFLDVLDGKRASQGPLSRLPKEPAGRERMVSYNPSGEDVFLDVLDGKRASQGPLSRLPKEPAGRERMVSYNPNGEDVFLDVLDGKRAANGILSRLPKEPAGRERMVSYNPNGEDILLDVLQGKRAANGILSRLPKEPAGRERMVAYPPQQPSYYAKKIPGDP
jgi:hypothetical protein